MIESQVAEQRLDAGTGERRPRELHERVGVAGCGCVAEKLGDRDRVLAEPAHTGGVSFPYRCERRRMGPQGDGTVLGRLHRWSYGQDRATGGVAVPLRSQDPYIPAKRIRRGGGQYMVQSEGIRLVAEECRRQTLCAPRSELARRDERNGHRQRETHAQPGCRGGRHPTPCQPERCRAECEQRERHGRQQAADCACREYRNHGQNIGPTRQAGFESPDQRSGRHPKEGLDDEHGIPIEPPVVGGPERVAAIAVQVIHGEVQRRRQGRGPEQQCPIEGRRRESPGEKPHLGACVQQERQRRTPDDRVRVAPMPEHIVQMVPGAAAKAPQQIEIRQIASGDPHGHERRLARSHGQSGRCAVLARRPF